jgi:hypothetical protein
VTPYDPNANALALQAATAAADSSADSAAPTYTLDSTRVPVEMLDRKHAEYALYSKTWDALTSLYDGSTAFKNDNTTFLQMRPKEMREIYQARSQQITYSPILTSAIGWYLSKLFENDPAVDIKISGKAIEAPDPITGKGGDPEWDFYDGFFEDCDGGGTPFFNVAREIYRIGILYRRCFVTLDLPKSVNQASNLAEQEQLLRPYLTVSDPRSVINWAADAYGNLDWIVFYNSFEEPRFLKPAVSVRRWTYYDRREYRVYEKRSDDNTQNDVEGDRLARLIDASGWPNASCSR